MTAPARPVVFQGDDPLPAGHRSTLVEAIGDVLLRAEEQDPYFRGLAQAWLDAASERMDATEQLAKDILAAVSQ
jgi:hypothetical protein